MIKILKKSFYALIFVIIAFVLFLKFTGMNINDIALKTLGFVKKMKGDAVDITHLGNHNLPVMDHDMWTSLLQKHVHENGNVHYKGFIEDSNTFNSYLTLLSDTPPGNNWSVEDKIAYWINVYNAFTVKLIIDHYPLKSIKDISSGLPMINSPWDIKFFKIGNIDFDLNTVEHQILRKEFDEARIHFAINCASFSCPKLRNEAFEGDKLEAQLVDQTKAFIQNRDKNIITNDQTSLSKIFSWFESDFDKQNGVQAFIKQYHANYNAQNKITYLEYDWSLNEE